MQNWGASDTSKCLWLNLSVSVLLLETEISVGVISSHLLPITKEQTRLAKAFMETYREKGYGKNVLGVGQATFFSFIYFGKLGELVFRGFLEKEGIPHQCKDILKPHPGKFKREGSDFVLTLTGETLDVKTVEESYKIRLLVREDQFRARRHNVYVGQRARDEKVMECWGFATGKELSKVRPTDFGYGPCRHWFLSSLHPIEEFIRKAKRGQKFEDA